MNCRCCSGKCRKSGSYHNRNRVVQRFFCERCGKSFKEEQPLDGVRIDAKQAAQVVHMLVEGCGIRAISRLTNLRQATVMNILAVAGEHCERLSAHRQSRHERCHDMSRRAHKPFCADFHAQIRPLHPRLFKKGGKLAPCCFLVCGAFQLLPRSWCVRPDASAHGRTHKSHLDNRGIAWL